MTGFYCGDYCLTEQREKRMKKNDKEGERRKKKKKDVKERTKKKIIPTKNEE